MIAAEPAPGASATSADAPGGVVLPVLAKLGIDAGSARAATDSALAQLPVLGESSSLQGATTDGETLAAIKAGKGLADVEATWAQNLAAFKARREQFLLYR